MRLKREGFSRRIGLDEKKLLRIGLDEKKLLRD